MVAFEALLGCATAARAPAAGGRSSGRTVGVGFGLGVTAGFGVVCTAGGGLGETAGELPSFAADELLGDDDGSDGAGSGPGLEGFAAGTGGFWDGYGSGLGV